MKRSILKRNNSIEGEDESLKHTGASSFLEALVLNLLTPYKIFDSNGGKHLSIISSSCHLPYLYQTLLLIIAYPVRSITIF